MVHRHNGIFLHYKKEHIWLSSNEVDESGAYYTEWGKWERERQILYINAYIWNLERWYWQSYMQGNKGDPDIKDRLLDSVEGKGGMIWEESTDTYVTICKMDSQWKSDVWCREPKASALWWPGGAGWGGRWGQFGRKRIQVCLWLIRVDVWLKPWQYCKVIILQLK